MANEIPDRRTKSYNMMRSLMDYGMGILYIGVGLFMFFPEKLGFDIGFDKTFRYIFGSICAAYGAWRIYRGIRKDYY